MTGLQHPVKMSAKVRERVKGRDVLMLFLVICCSDAANERVSGS